MHSRILTHLVILIFYTAGSSISQESQNNKLTSLQWSQDIDAFINGIPEVHVNPYHKTSKEEFQKFSDDLKLKLPAMFDNQIFVEFVRMIALIGDGHSGIDFGNFHNENNARVPVISVNSYPLKPYLFSDGVYIVFADDRDKVLKGMKLTKINGIDLETVIDKVTPLVHNDNEYTIKFMLPFYLVIAEYLNGLGLIPDNYIAEFTFEDKYGKEIVRTLEPVSQNEYTNILHNMTYPDDAPLYLQNDEKNYWYKYLEREKVLYLNYKRVLIDQSDSLTSFCRRLQGFVDTHDIDKTVIDIRNNGGGNNGTCQPFVNFISRNKKINQRGKLFTIIGRQTFSAASYLTTKLELNTNTIFVGEPTGASPNHYGDNRPLVLPNSGITVRLSSIYWKNSFPLDTREYTEPEVKVDLSSNDFFSNRDPVLEAIKKFDYTGRKNSKIPADKGLDLTGRYILEPLQLLEVKKDGDVLMLEVRKPDFIGRDVTFIYTPLYKSSGQVYSTGINGFNISQTRSGLRLSYRGIDLDIDRAGSDYKLPEQLFREGNYTEAIKILKEVKSQYPDNENVSEARINSLGYVFVNEHNLESAIEIFKLNTELYPHAFNTYDSLGEVYLMAGNEQLAIDNYKKSVELNDRNENGKKVLQKLNAK